MQKEQSARQTSETDMPATSASRWKKAAKDTAESSASDSVAVKAHRGRKRTWFVVTAGLSALALASIAVIDPGFPLRSARFLRRDAPTDALASALEGFDASAARLGQEVSWPVGSPARELSLTGPAVQADAAGGGEDSGGPGDDAALGGAAPPPAPAPPRAAVAYPLVPIPPLKGVVPWQTGALVTGTAPLPPPEAVFAAALHWGPPGFTRDTLAPESVAAPRAGAAAASPLPSLAPLPSVLPAPPPPPRSPLHAFFDHIYLVNLPRRRDRLALAQLKLRRLGISAQVRGVREAEEEEAAHPHLPPPPSAGVGRDGRRRAAARRALLRAARLGAAHGPQLARRSGRAADVGRPRGRRAGRGVRPHPCARGRREFRSGLGGLAGRARGGAEPRRAHRPLLPGRQPGAVHAGAGKRRGEARQERQPGSVAARREGCLPVECTPDLLPVQLSAMGLPHNAKPDAVPPRKGGKKGQGWCVPPEGRQGGEK